MTQESGDPRAPTCQCSNWAEIAESLEWFPAPETSLGPDGVSRCAWVFRGVGSSHYELQPSIERDVQPEGMGWHALEHVVSEEFKARAGVHLSASLIPLDELGWLALMQHYGVPTRLVDFTYSPFVALYFAARACRLTRCGTGRYVRLWAIHEDSVNGKFERVARKALAKNEGKPVTDRMFGRARSERDDVISGTVGMRKKIEELLPARGNLQRDLNERGCVCAISPPAFNPRLASQQGVFLLNLAGGLTFNGSLAKMMQAHPTAEPQSDPVV